MNEREARLQEQINSGLEHHRRGDLNRALANYMDVLRVAPLNFDALQLVGVLEGQRKNSEVSIGYLRRAMSVRPDDVSLLGNLGAALLDLDRCDQALEVLDRAVRLSPSNPNVLKNRAAALRRLSRLEEAVASYSQLLAQQPDHKEALHFLGLTLCDLGRHNEAIGNFERLLQLQPQKTDTLNALGLAFRATDRATDAAAVFQAAVNADPAYAIGYNNLGEVLFSLGDTKAAFDACSKAIRLNPELAEAYNNLGNCLFQAGDLDGAIASYSRALKLKPEWTEALCNRAMVFSEAKQPERAVEDFKLAFSLEPDVDFLLGHLWYAQMQVCDWTSWQSKRAELVARIERGQKTIAPFPALMIDSAHAQQTAARIWSRAIDRDGQAAPHHRPAGGRGQRIRIAYLSADFRRHAMMVLLSGVFAAHDKSRFDVTAVFHGAFPEDDVTTSVSKSFERFIDTHQKSDQEIVEIVRSLQIDVAIDLMGYTRGCVPQVFKTGIAPVQINYLGFPGTMGSRSHDYIVGDRTVIPESHRDHYDENVIWLPDTYQPAGSDRTMADTGISRSGAGLPEKGFVFCCFNNTYKITPIFFDLWADILGQVPDSVIWLIEPSPEAISNLHREMAARGVSADRVVFAKRLGGAQHLERHKLADLFLDTLPYNAHTTASDALWAGLPLLTVRGDCFASRVAASLLQAIGLPELVTSNQQDYVALAVSLARDPARLSSLKEKLSRNKRTHPLFDTARYTRNLERAIEEVHQRHLQGKPAMHIEL